MKIYLKPEVKEIIARLNLTYWDFGSQIGCDTGYTSKLVNGQMEVSAKRRRAILKFFKDYKKDYKFDDLFVIKEK